MRRPNFTYSQLIPQTTFHDGLSWELELQEMIKKFVQLVGKWNIVVNSIDETVMALFFNSQDPSVVKFFKKGNTINGQNYANFLNDCMAPPR